MVVWYSLWSFGIFEPRKIWQPWFLNVKAYIQHSRWDLIPSKPFNQDFFASRNGLPRIARFALTQYTKTGVKYTNFTTTSSNGYKMYQIALKYIKWP
jgi:hypothetical protein